MRQGRSGYAAKINTIATDSVRNLFASRWPRRDAL